MKDARGSLKKKTDFQEKQREKTRVTWGELLKTRPSPLGYAGKSRRGTNRAKREGDR